MPLCTLVPVRALLPAACPGAPARCNSHRPQEGGRIREKIPVSAGRGAACGQSSWSGWV